MAATVKTNTPTATAAGGDVVLHGYLKKLKTMKKKYFVLRSDSAEASARLEYYDSEKKYKARLPPKRAILLRSCFNINRRSDTKHKCVIALYTKDDCFCMLLDAEADLAQWLRALLALQRGGEDENDSGEAPRPTFEHVWQVTVQKRGLGASRNISGRYHLCLNDNTLSLVRIGGGTGGAGTDSVAHQHGNFTHRTSAQLQQQIQIQTEETIEFPLILIRRSGALESFFYMEVGRSTVTGAGELWMLSDDPNIAQNMNSIIQTAMRNTKSKNDFGPKSRNRSSSATESSKPIFMQQRRQTHGGKAMNFSPNSVPMMNTVRNPQYSSCSGVAAAGLPCWTFCKMSPATNTVSLLQQNSAARAASQRRHSVSGSAASGRERCDSLPSRARTASETGPANSQQQQQQQQQPQQQHPNMGQQQRGMTHRTHSMHSRGLSYSPPGGVAGSPVMSPPSVACSTDSAGSSLSIDETDCYGHSMLDDSGLSSRFIVPSDTQVIPEETSDECWAGGDGFEEDYVNTRVAGLRLPLSDTIGLGTSCSAGTSPADRLAESGPYVPMSPGTAGTSPPNYRHSRTSSIAEDGGEYRYVGGASSSTSVADSGYVPMAAAVDSGYVPMAPIPTHDYADMEPVRPASRTSVTSGTPSTDLRFSEYHLEKVTSYFAPSSDDEDSSSSRPVRAYSVGSRPEMVARKNRLDALNTEQSNNSNNNSASRIRAFSVGSRTKLQQQQQMARQTHHHVGYHHAQHPQAAHHVSNHQHGRKANSAPLLSASWGERTGRTLHGSVEPMDDLMEIDFTRNPATEKSSANISSSTVGKRRHTKDEGYVDMASKPTSSANGYVEMRPLGSSSSPDTLTSPDVVDGYMDMTPGSTSTGSTGTPNTSFQARSNTHRNNQAPSTSPLQPNCVSSPRCASLPQPVKQPQPQSQTRQSSQPQPYMNMTGNGGTVKQQARSQPVDFPRRRTQPPEGYVEMSWNGGRKNNKPISGSADDYMSMSFEKVYKKHQKNLRNSDAASRHSSSQPITIRSGSTDASPKPPPGYLPLTPSGTSSRQRRESKDSGVVTPSGSQNAIFPFSPGSPAKPFAPTKTHNPRKCPVDASSGTVCLDDDDDEEPNTRTVTAPISEPEMKILNTDCSASDASTSGNDSDYVNCSPVRRTSDPAGDYALMLAPVLVQTSVTGVGIQPPQSATAGFRPITAGPEPISASRKGSDTSSPRPSMGSALNRQLSERRGDITPNQQQQDGSAGYELLAVRPSSAGAERLPSRPGSVSGERELHYASLDLPPEAERSPRCGDAPMSASPSPNPEPAFTYAQIDFLKSENLKVKH